MLVHVVHVTMNEPNSKKILFNKSTLLSLKAELLKKQEEVMEKKQLPQHKVEYFKPKNASEQKSASDNENKKKFKDRLIALNTEELESCRKSKLILEKKAELYNHLADGAGESQLDGQFLVNFKEKKQQEDSKPKISQAGEYNTNVDNNNDEGDWTEFSDCLGRTRVCLTSELEFYKKRDQELIKLMLKEENPSEEPKTEKPFLVQKTNDYLQSLREKWEEKERELLAKDKDIHYQDLLFDEARMHGVGYYAFSTDETERRKQMSELLRQRQETLRAQKEAEEVRRKRDELVAARVAAARARQRARAGLPPEEPTVSETQKDFTTCLLEFLTEQKNEADNRAEDEEKRIKEVQEKERQKLREAYVREWDIGKEGVDVKFKKFREMTQEEYVEQQRSRRIKEFAPLEASHRNKDKKNNTFDSSGKIVQNDHDVSSTPKSWSDVRPRPKTPPPPFISNLLEPETQKGLYFSSKKPETVVKFRNYIQQQEPTPIVNELNEDESSENGHRKCEKRKLTSNHTEIAPPPTYEYYGPVPKQIRSQKPFHSDIQEAYAQGAKSLEPKTGERQLSKNYDFTFD